MPYITQARDAGRQRVATSFILLALVLPLASITARAQQDYIARYNVYSGFTFLDSPHVSLFEKGYHLQTGVNPKTWLALGFDYSVSTGSLTLTPALLTPALQEELGGLLEELGLPTNYPIAITSNSLTQTFAGGPQLEFRHFKKVTLFLRPSFGAIHEVATPQPGNNQVYQIIVAALTTNGKKTDTTPFYGGGGGGDFNFSKHIAVRVQADLVYDHLFSNTLEDGRLTIRFSIGPCFNFGKNIRKN